VLFLVLPAFLLACGDDAATGGGAGAGGAAVNTDPFCSTRPKLAFCEDFDVLPIPGAFSEQAANGATLSIESGDAASAPSFLRVATQGSAAAPATGALSHAFPAGERLRLFAQLYVPSAAPPSGDAEIGAFELGDGSYRAGFGGSADGSWWAFEDVGGVIERTAGMGALPRDAWVSVRWDVNVYADGTGTALLRFGNDTVLQLGSLAPPMGLAGEAKLVVGIAAATGAWDVRFDNVTVEIED
jgi:hypothetical protein